MPAMRAHLGPSTLQQNFPEGSEAHRHLSALALHSFGIQAVQARAGSQPCANCVLPLVLRGRDSLSKPLRGFFIVLFLTQGLFTNAWLT